MFGKISAGEVELVKEDREGKFRLQMMKKYGEDRKTAGDAEATIDAAGGL